MKYQKRKTETLHAWVKRLSEEVMWHRIEPETIRDILSEVSKTSYIEGALTEREIIEKYRKYPQTKLL
jgi:hypothetical protein